MRLKNKVAVITGGAQGIGKETAKRFLQEGATVALFDMNEEQLKTASDELAEYGEVLTDKVNVAVYEEVEKAVNRVIEKKSKVDIMIANAGITRDSMVHKMDTTKFDQVIDVNLKGAYNSARAVVEKMREQGSGRIIFTSSVVGEYGNIGQANYAASKAGLIGMAKSMAKEMGRKNVTVNVVAPGYTNTEMMKTVPEKVLNIMCEKTPMARLAEPVEIANGFLFLASDEASFVTGHVLSVNGGLTL